jgi:hypothetical protein
LLIQPLAEIFYRHESPTQAARLSHAPDNVIQPKIFPLDFLFVRAAGVFSVGDDEKMANKMANKPTGNRVFQ